MARLKRLFYYLLINVLVSACTTLAVIQAWAWRQPAGNDPGPVGAIFTQAALGAGNAAPAPATAGIVVVTRMVTVPPELFTPYPTRGIVSYTVKEGDTLSGIARYFDVSLEELMALNDISDPDRVISGLPLLIPAPPTQTPTPLPVPSETPTVTTTPRPSPTSPFSPTPTGPTATPAPFIQAVVAAGDLANERITLKISGGGEISLEGWRLRAEDGSEFIFPRLTLRAGAEIHVYTRAGENSVSALYWGLAQPMWAAGKTITLLDPSGAVRATFTTP